MNTRKPS